MFSSVLHFHKNNSFMKKMRLLFKLSCLLFAILADGVKIVPGVRSSRHWKNWIYSSEAHHWHTLWCQWKPSGEPIQPATYMERIFAPTPTGSVQRNVYHFKDARGTVSDGYMCGPWYMHKDMSTDEGIVHPFSATHTTLLLPGGSCAWTNKTIARGTPLRCESFIHRRSSPHLRVSASVVYSENGELEGVMLFREDDRSPWPSAEWSADCNARLTSTQELSSILSPYNDITGRSDEIDAELDTSTKQGLTFSDCRPSRVSNDDVVLVCADKTIVIVAPRKIPQSSFSVCCSWLGDGTFDALEVHWEYDENIHRLCSVRHLDYSS